MTKTLNILNLDIDAVRDFQLCARLYGFRHAENETEPIPKQKILEDKYEEAMKAVVSYFFFKRQGGVSPSFANLSTRWEKQWFAPGTDFYDIMHETHTPDSKGKNPASYTTEAMKSLLSFHETFAKDKRDPVLINDDFRHPLGPDIVFHGSIDLMLMDAKTKKTSVIKWITSKRRPSAGSLLMEFAAIKHYLDQRRGAANRTPIQYGIYDLVSTRQAFVPVEVSKDDVNAYLFWVNEIRNSNVFPSRYGLTAYCKSCPFNDQCFKWTFPEPEL